jgi:hypothetical protein
VSVFLGDEEEDGQEGEDEKHGHVDLLAPLGRRGHVATAL